MYWLKSSFGKFFKTFLIAKFGLSFRGISSHSRPYIHIILCHKLKMGLKGLNFYFLQHLFRYSSNYSSIIIALIPFPAKTREALYGPSPLRNVM